MFTAAPRSPTRLHTVNGTLGQNFGTDRCSAHPPPQNQLKLPSSGRRNRFRHTMWGTVFFTSKQASKKKKFKLHHRANGEGAGGGRRKSAAGGRGGRGGWYRRGFVKTRRAQGLGLFFFFLPFPPKPAKAREAGAFRIHLKFSVDSAQGSVGAANANQVYNHQPGREKREEKNNLQVP